MHDNTKQLGTLSTTKRLVSFTVVSDFEINRNEQADDQGDHHQALETF